MCGDPFDFVPDLNMDGKKDFLDLIILDAILEDEEEETETDDSDIFADDDDFDDVDDLDSDCDGEDDDWEYEKICEPSYPPLL